MYDRLAGEVAGGVSLGLSKEHTTVPMLRGVRLGPLACLDAQALFHRCLLDGLNLSLWSHGLQTQSHPDVVSRDTEIPAASVSSMATDKNMNPVQSIQRRGVEGVAKVPQADGVVLVDEELVFTGVSAKAGDTHRVLYAMQQMDSPKPWIELHEYLRRRLPMIARTSKETKRHIKRLLNTGLVLVAPMTKLREYEGLKPGVFYYAVSQKGKKEPLLPLYRPWWDV